MRRLCQLGLCAQITHLSSGKVSCLTAAIDASAGRTLVIVGSLIQTVRSFDGRSRRPGVSVEVPRRKRRLYLV